MRICVFYSSVGFASLDVVCNELNDLMIVPGILICSSLLISGCMFIVSKVVLMSSATVFVRAGGAICLNCRVCVHVLRGCVWYVFCCVR